MRTSTEIGSSSRIIGEERAIECVARAGFDAWDFTMTAMCNYDWNKGVLLKSDHPLAQDNYLAFARKLRQIGLDNGIECNQSHAPFPTTCHDIRSYFKRSIECTAEAGGKICIIHPDNNQSPEENAEMYFGLLPFAKEHGVKIAAENMWNWDEVNRRPAFAACATSESFLAHFNAVNDDFLVACLDVGHAEMENVGSGAANMIRALGSHLQALHLHDNDKFHDSHQIPFSMSLDFGAIIAALRDIGYSGDLTLEADAYLKSRGYKTVDEVQNGMNELYASVKRLSDMFEA